MPVRLTVIGSGDAFNGGGRGNACYLVEDGAGAFCVDFGPTALMNLKARRFDPARLDAVLLTHLHGDHFGGLHLLLIDAQYASQRERPLVIAGPVGTAKKVDAWYRLAYANAAKKRRFPLEYRELRPGESLTFGGRTVSALAAQHMKPRDGALYLRVATEGATLAFTGDTGWSERLPALADGADLLVSECTSFEPTPGDHLSWKELAPKLPLLKAKRILLTHLCADMRARTAKLKAPRVRFADDGMRVLVRR